METITVTSALSALWMGMLATVSPCPLGTNVAAVTIIAAGGGKRAMNAVVAASSYGLGRMLTHALLGALILAGFATAPGAAAIMQLIPSKISGPLFIILGVILSGWIEIPMPKSAGALKRKILKKATGGPWQAFFVGCIFSLIPCPETAALFFGGMIPMAMESGSLFTLPLIFGLGTALPLMLLGILLSFGINSFVNNLGRVRTVEPILRALSCAAFLAIGLYLTLTHVYHLL